MKSLIPVVMAGILGIYGMIVAVIISQRSRYTLSQLKTQMIILKKMDFRIWLQDWFVDSAVSYTFTKQGSRIFDWASRRRRNQKQCSSRKNICWINFNIDLW